MSTLMSNNHSELPFNGLVDFELISEFECEKDRILTLLSDHNLINPLKENKLKHILHHEAEHICDYYDNDRLMQTKLITVNSLNIMTLNIRSLPKHAGELM